MTLQPVLNFLSRWVVDGRFGEMVCEVMGLLLGELDGEAGKARRTLLCTKMSHVALAMLTCLSFPVVHFLPFYDLYIVTQTSTVMS